MREREDISLHPFAFVPFFLLIKSAIEREAASYGGMKAAEGGRES